MDENVLVRFIPCHNIWNTPLGANIYFLSLFFSCFVFFFFSCRVLLGVLSFGFSVST